MSSEPVTNPLSAHTAAQPPSTKDALYEVMRFLRVMRFRMSYVVTTVLVVALLGVLYYATATRIYQAKAAVLVSQSGSDVWNASMTGDDMRDSFIPTYEKLFSSPTVMDAAVKRLTSLPPESRIDFNHLPRDKWAEAILANFSASNSRRTSIIELTYQSKSPQAAEAVLQAILDSYLDFMERTYRDVSVEIATLLDVKIKENDKQFEDAQKQLLDIKRQSGIVIRDKDNFVHPLVQRVVELNQAKLQVQKERIDLEATRESIRDAVAHQRDLRQYLLQVEPNVGRELLMNGFGLNPHFAEVIGNVERKVMDDNGKLEAQSKYYGPTHPAILELHKNIEEGERYLQDYRANVNKRLNGIRDEELGPMLVSMIEEKLSKTKAHEIQLDHEYELASTNAVQLNNRLVELQIAEDRVERLRSFQLTLQNRLENIDLNSKRPDVRVKVVGEPMAPRKPVSPKLKIIAMICLVAGLGLGGGSVYILDLLDDRFRSPEELKDQLGVPLLALVRNLEVEAKTGADAIHSHINPRSVQSEAFRTLRTTLAFADQDLRRLAVTSAEPNDGKTTVLSNLAVSYTQTGKRVLIIDADMRKPGLSKLFAMRGTAGMSEVLRTDDDIDAMCRERIQPSGVPNLDILPCGAKPSNPAELLTSARFADLVAWAETQYDQLLIDCPPVMAAADAAIVGRTVDGMLLVVQPAKNHRRLVIRAAESLLTLQVNLLGVVANRVGDESDTQGYYGYGSYGYGYGYGYGESGYGQEEEEETNSSSEAEKTETPATLPSHDQEPSRSNRHGSNKPRRAA
jgi:succinoglycan biosynthesis transport protein ExoP